MPTLKKLKKTVSEKHIGESKGKAIKIYNSKEWKKLRKAHIMLNPLCQDCLEKGIVKQAEEVHHIKPILSAKDDLEMLTLALDPDNLRSLCADCHHITHNKTRRGSR